MRKEIGAFRKKLGDAAKEAAKTVILNVAKRVNLYKELVYKVS
jgi:hypothetical protein